jgi:hypothetical protein
MRTAFLAAAVLVACLGGVARGDAELDAVQNIKKLGGNIIRDPNQSSQPVAQAFLKGKKTTDEVLASVRVFPKLIILDVRDASVTDKGLKHLAGLPKLRILRLFNLPVTDAGILAIKDCKSVTWVEIKDCPKVTAKGIAALKKAMPKCAINREPR